MEHFRAQGIVNGGSNVSSNLAAGGMVIGNTGVQGALTSGDELAGNQMKYFRGWPFAAIRPIAQTISGLQFCMGYETRPNDVAPPERQRTFRERSMPSYLRNVSENITLVEANPLLDVLNNPNHVMTGWHLKYLTICGLELTGKAFWWMTETEGQPTIWPIPAHWIQPVHEDDVPVAKWAVSPGGSGVPIPVPANEIAFFYYPDPSSPLDALGPLQASSKAILADESMQEAQEVAFRNGIWPGLAIIAGDVTDEDGENEGRPLLEKEQRVQIHNAIRRHYAGVVRMNEALILDAMIKDVKKISQNPHEMDFTGSGEVTYGRITQGFGTPPFVMGKHEGGTRASSAVAKKHFADFTINPKVELLNQTLTKTIGTALSRPNRKVYIWIEEYRPDDTEETRKDWALATKEKAVTRNEVRVHLLGLPAWENGVGDDIVLTPAQIVAPVEGLPIPEPANQDDDEKKKDTASLIAPPSRLPTTLERATEWQRVHAKREASFLKDLEKFFDEQREEVIARLLELFSKSPRTPSDAGFVELLYHEAEWTEKLLKIARSSLLGTMVEGAARQVAEAKETAKAVSEDVLLGGLPPNTSSAVKAELQTIMDRPYWASIQATTKTEIAATLGQAIDNHENLYQMAVRIGDSPTVPVPGGANGVLGSASNTRRGFSVPPQTLAGGSSSPGRRRRGR
jgi:phage portal protein BeeE